MLIRISYKEVADVQHRVRILRTIHFPDLHNVSNIELHSLFDFVRKYVTI